MFQELAISDITLKTIWNELYILKERLVSFTITNQRAYKTSPNTHTSSRSPRS